MLWVIGAVLSAILIGFVRNRLTRQWRALSLAGMQARRRKDWSAAAKFYRQAHETAGRMQEPARSKLQAEVEIEWAGVMHRQGKMQQAAEMFRSGYSKVVVDCWRSRLIVCQGYLYWGDLCTDEARYGEAEQHYRQAVKSCESIGNAAGIVFALQRLGDVLVRQERRADAEQAIQRAIALESQGAQEQRLRQGKMSAGNPVIPTSIPDLHFCREDYDVARRLYREKISFWEQHVRPDNIDFGYLQIRLALAEARTGHDEAALEMWDRAESTLVREWGEGHPKVSAARLARAVSRDLAAV